MGLQTVRKEVTSCPNPNFKRLPQIEEQINKMREQKREKENERLSMKQDTGKEVGLSKELEYFWNIVYSSPWIVKITAFAFFVFFLMIELLVLVSAWSYKKDDDNDYEKIINHQMRTRIKKLENLSN